ncbi:hypothetical protein KFL_004020130 [Klebsormidium nitens]|uniref:DUF3598 domain-containing protein n=1 Tax=Klebsormidium nitens TaxID=105231 RepID=A0A1Y1IHD2_KLENI|nr:hypothetical protein KFL_004020130 [Klebsormidium nitens]|eukprot:GAQ88127.1 hypothetical protein KFL_004020130 [Klebsormidium nitens]
MGVLSGPRKDSGGGRPGGSQGGRGGGRGSSSERSGQAGGRRSGGSGRGGERSGDGRGGKGRGKGRTEGEAKTVAPKEGGLRIKSESVIQEEEPAGTPQWDTFVSSLSGVWEGMAGAFSPITGKMEPLALDEENSYLFDALSHCFVEGGVSVPAKTGGETANGVRRQVFWTVGNAAEKNEGQYQDDVVDDVDVDVEDDVSGLAGERAKLERALAASEGASGEVRKEGGETKEGGDLEEGDELDWEEFEEGDFEEGDEFEEDDDDDMEESQVEDDVMGREPGLIFFEDGSYSRGPLDLLNNVQVDDVDPDSVADDDPQRRKYNFNPASVIEQCVVRGGHRRLRLVHTVGVEGGGLNLMRLAVTEEEWMGPLEMEDISASKESPVVPYSLRESTSSSELEGQWKVFERIATVLHGSEAEDAAGPSAVTVGGPRGDTVTVCYSTREVLRERFDETQGKAKGLKIKGRDEDEDVILLPGGVTSTISVKPEGGLTFGVGWLDEDGTRAFMERSYQANGRLDEVRSGQEVKGGWVGGSM